jgi:hypothetical protein
MLQLRRKPTKVSQFPFRVDSDLLKARMKIGSTTIHALQYGIILLALVDMKIPTPRTNQTRGKKFFFVIFKRHLDFGFTGARLSGKILNPARTVKRRRMTWKMR